jgi:hypothetical protein
MHAISHLDLNEDVLFRCQEDFFLPSIALAMKVRSLSH